MRLARSAGESRDGQSTVTAAWAGEHCLGDGGRRWGGTDWTCSWKLVACPLMQVACPLMQHQEPGCQACREQSVQVRSAEACVRAAGGAWRLKRRPLQLPGWLTPVGSTCCCSSGGGGGSKGPAVVDKRNQEEQCPYCDRRVPARGAGAAPGQQRHLSPSRPYTRLSGQPTTPCAGCSSRARA
jgi:hypothetical protein